MGKSLRDWANSASGHLPLLLATILTILFGLYTYALSRQIVTIEGVTLTRFGHFLSGSPNTMGDTLSGFVGSLTLIWVVASVLQQSQELRYQREELQATRAEFEKMAAAQSAQVRTLEAHAEVFRDERRRASEKEFAAVFNNELRALLEMVIEFRQAIQGSDGESFCGNLLKHIDDLAVSYSTQNYRENDVSVQKYLKTFQSVNNKKVFSENDLINFEQVVDLLEETLAMLFSFSELESKVGMITKKRIERLNIVESQSRVSEVLTFLLRSKNLSTP